MQRMTEPAPSEPTELRWQKPFNPNQEGCTVAQACAGRSRMGSNAQEEQLLPGPVSQLSHFA